MDEYTENDINVFESGLLKYMNHDIVSDDLEIFIKNIDNTLEHSIVNIMLNIDKIDKELTDKNNIATEKFEKISYYQCFFNIDVYNSLFDSIMNLDHTKNEDEIIISKYLYAIINVEIFKLKYYNYYIILFNLYKKTMVENDDKKNKLPYIKDVYDIFNETIEEGLNTIGFVKNYINKYNIESNDTIIKLNENEYFLNNIKFN